MLSVLATTLGLMLFVLVSFVLLGVVIYMFCLLYRFGTQAVAGVDHHDGESMSAGLATLGRYYKTGGFLVIFYIAVVSLGLIFAVAGGAFGLPG